MTSITQIEDRLIEELQGLELFSTVESAGRQGRPEELNYPAALVYFVEERDTGSRPRPIVMLDFAVLAGSQNLRSEKDAAQDTYALIDSVRDALIGKTFGFDDLELFWCVSRLLAGYEDDGSIWYELKFRARQYLPVPVDDNQ